MCGPEVVWELATLDMAYVMTLMGGALVLRARSASAVSWALFGTLGVAVGGFLFWATYHAQTAVMSAQTQGILTGAC